jgi:ribonuclease P protein component
MKPAIRRLKTRPEFLRVAASRRKRVAPGLVLQVLRRRTPPGTEVEDSNAIRVIRVGFTASRKVGNAVARNRARRRLRAVAGEVLPVMGQAGHDYVLIARAATAARPYPALVEDLKQAMAGLGEETARAGRAKNRPRKAGSGQAARQA